MQSRTRPPLTGPGSGEAPDAWWALVDRRNDVVALVGVEPAPGVGGGPPRPRVLRVRYSSYGVPTLEPAAGDLTGDGAIGPADLALLGSLTGSQLGDSSYRADADLNFDGVIDGDDLTLLTQRQGQASVHRGLWGSWAAGASGGAELEGAPLWLSVGYAGAFYDRATGLWLMRQRWCGSTTSSPRSLAAYSSLARRTPKHTTSSAGYLKRLATRAYYLTMPATATDSAEATTHQWRVHSDRVAPLIDGVEYFAALREALINARHAVFIIGWEIHSEIDLLRGEQAEQVDDGWPIRFADLLLALADRRPAMEIRLLIWEGAPLFALERQHVPRMKRPWDNRSNLHLKWDRDTPPLGSQHQKLVVVDDRVAFVGGMDITKSRWDTHDHEPGDRRRRVPGLIPRCADPYHDAMLVIDDQSARTLGGWCRERWARATGERLDAPDPGALEEGHDPWPRSVTPAIESCRVDIALTQPDHDGRPEKRQVQHAFIEQIAHARRLIFIETQYFTSEPIADALAERLREPNGPEVVLILPWGCPGVIQASAMDPRRDTLLERLRDADAHDRFRVYWPTLAGGDTRDVFTNSVYVHAKVLIIDDQLLRIGSANMANRSMGLDTELDATIRLPSDHPGCDAIRTTRHRLTAYLLHTDPHEIAERESAHHSAVRAIDALRGGSRTLRPFDHQASSRPTDAVLAIGLADPDRPPSDVDAQRIMHEISKHIPLRARAPLAWNTLVGAMRRSRAALGLVLLAIGVVAIWRFTPLAQHFDDQAARNLLSDLLKSPLGASGVLLAFVTLAGVGAPVTLMIGAVGALFGAPAALIINTLGVAGAALPGFLLGRIAPSTAARRLKSGRLNAIADRVRDHPIVAIVILRNIPIAPYAVVNTALGTTRVVWIRYLSGTMLGMLPGIVLLTLAGDRFVALITDPSPATLLTLASLIALFLLVGATTRFVIRRRRRAQEPR